MKHIKLSLIVAAVSLLSPQVMASDIYGPYPITLQGYAGDKTNSVSYSVKLAVSYNSLKSYRQRGIAG